MATIDVTVVEPDGTHPAESDVYAFRRAPGDYFRAESFRCSAREGKAVFDDLSPGRYLLAATSPGLAASELVPLDVDGSPKSASLTLRPAGSIEGRVLSERTGQPLSGASVHVCGMEELLGAETAGDGSFLLEQVPVGDAALIVAHDNYAWEVVDGLAVDAGPPVEAPDIALSDGGRVEGVVTDGGVPLADEEIWLRGPYGPAKRGTTDQSGSFTFRGVKTGTNVVVRGYLLDGRIARLVTVEDGQTVSVGFEIQGPGTLEGVIVADGQPRPEIAVTFYEFSEGGELRSFCNELSDENGSFSFGLSGSTDSVLALFFAGEIDGSMSSFLEPLGRSSEIGTQRTFSFPSGIAAGVIVDERGRPVQGAEVTIARRGIPPTCLAAGQSDQDGRFAVRHLASGAYRLSAQCTRYVNANADLEIGDEEIVEVGRIVMGESVRRSQRLRGVVQGPDGKPVKALLILRDSEGFPTGMQTHSDLGGSFRFDEVPPGTYTITGEGEVSAFTHVSGIRVEEDRPTEVVVTLDSR